MRQINFANQANFEKHARPSRREQFLNTAVKIWILRTYVIWIAKAFVFLPVRLSMPASL